MTKNSSVITRFAPSPTGHLHIGGARTALFSYLYAKQNGGKYVLRIEDTDKERNKQEYEDAIFQAFEWLGIASDDTPVRQSERLDVHKKALQKLIENGAGYEAEESESGSGKVIRFKNPNKEITFTDLIRGEVTFDTTELEDFVIARNIEEPLYHLAVVVDDGDMGITHVIRGEEHISNTPRQILILEALNYTRPTYAHLPLILAPDRSKLSKRHGDVSVNEYKKAGYLPEAINNYLALLGWHPEGDQEIFSLHELTETFDLSRVQKGGAIFDTEKLDWVNKEHLAKLSDEMFEEGIKPFLPEKYHGEKLKHLLPMLRERISKFSDVVNEDLDYFYEKPTYKAGDLVWKNSDTNTTRKHLEWIYAAIESMEGETYSEVSIKQALWEYATSEGRGDVLWPLRFALSGKEKSPDPFTLADVLGKDEALSRIKLAINLLS